MLKQLFYLFGTADNNTLEPLASNYFLFRLSLWLVLRLRVLLEVTSGSQVVVSQTFSLANAVIR